MAFPDPNTEHSHGSAGKLYQFSHHASTMAGPSISHQAHIQARRPQRQAVFGAKDPLTPCGSLLPSAALVAPQARQTTAFSRLFGQSHPPVRSSAGLRAAPGTAQGAKAGSAAGAYVGQSRENG